MRIWVAMRTGIAAGLLFALAGCADVPQSHGYLLLSNQLEEQSQFLLYRDELNSGDIAILRGKINFAETYYPKLPACRLVMGNGYPTPAESAALRRWAAVRAAYFEQFYTLELRTTAGSDKVAP